MDFQDAGTPLAGRPADTQDETHDTALQPGVVDPKALPAWAFGRIGQELEDRGFPVIPIYPGDKRPFGRDWPHRQPVRRYLPARAGFSVGMLTQWFPALDVDVRDVELAFRLSAMIRATAGDAPERIGSSPKALFAFRTDQPFWKRATRKYHLPGDPADHPGHQLEVLGDGEQFVCFGRHPSTGREYVWPSDSLLNLEASDLPQLTAELADGIVERAEAMFLEAGGRPISKSGTVDRVPYHPRMLLGEVYEPHRRFCEGQDEEDQILNALMKIKAEGLDYTSWIEVMYGIKRAFGERGRDLWLVWSSQSSKDNPNYTAGRWDQTPIEHIRCGWRRMITLAERFGS